MKQITSITFLILIYLQTATADTHESHLLNQYQRAVSIEATQADSAYQIYDSIHMQAVIEKDSLMTVKCLLGMGFIGFMNLNNPETFDQLTEALYISELNHYTKERAIALRQLSKIYFRFSKNEIGEAYLKQCLGLNKELVRTQELKAEDLIPTYLDYCQLEKGRGNTIKAQLYLDTCFTISKASDRLPIQDGYLNLEKAELYIINKRYDKALEILEPLDHYYANVTTEKGYSINTSIHAFVLSDIAKIKHLRGLNDQALHYYYRAYRTNINHGLHHASQNYLLTTIAVIFAEKEDYKSAYENLADAKIISDRYFKISNKRNINTLSLKDSYREELKRKEKELVEQQLILAEKEKAIFRFRAFILCSILLIAIGFLILYNKVQNSKHTNKELLSKQQAEEKERNNQEIISVKNKELTSYTLQLIERDDLLDKFSAHAKLDTNSKDAKSLVLARKQMTSNSWEEFNQRFVSVNSDFYLRLEKRFPELTNTDLKHCALIKLNFSGKEMANLLGISEKSVHMARYRIRKKFGIDTETNLTKYIESI